MDKENRVKIKAQRRPFHLEGMVQQIKPTATWENLTFPKSMLTELRNICSKFTLSRGLAILFTGPNGTGKTMAAEAIAHDLRLNLYRIDLSAVVSKYIGETEKNLSQVFAEAEDSNAIIFFDEADVLFGKRGEAKDSHDRYANIEINYLLRRMEAYRGLVILAINNKDAMDAAVLRRIHSVVVFPVA